MGPWHYVAPPIIGIAKDSPFPMIALLEAHRAGLFRRGEIWHNVVAGVVVGIVALPLGMAFAIASGAKPEQGLYTAIVAGLATSLLGGTRVQVSGPTGAFIAVLAGITAKYGIAGLQAATLMAGAMLFVMGVLKLGSVIRFIPNPVIVGFTSGIAVIIFVGQWQYFFGLSPVAADAHFHGKFWALVQALPGLHPATTGIAVLALRSSWPATGCSIAYRALGASRRRSSRCSPRPRCSWRSSSRAWRR